MFMFIFNMLQIQHTSIIDLTYDIKVHKSFKNCLETIYIELISDSIILIIPYKSDKNKKYMYGP